ncbi:DUF1349 domain-containing protein [Motilibacter sp. K478]|nr:DUF1349 domain-containing protein [Motilibacter aurantiacus]
MVRPIRRLLALTVAAALGLPTVGVLAPAQAAEAEPFKALVFSKTAGFRHDAIPAALAAIQKLGQENDFTVDSTEDASKFTDANLAQYDVVIWNSTTGDVLDDAQQAAFERYIRNGGGYAGLHSASDTEYSWPWYGKLVGAYFDSHPQNQNVTVKTEDRAHPSTAHLPASATRFDELYNYRTNPRDTVHVLQSYDERSYSGGNMGSDHPITWCQDYDGGRAWYTGQGHTQESYAEPAFLKLLLGGIQTAAGVLDADCAASQSGSFDKVALDENTQNPMDFDVAPDGRTFYTERDGRVQVIGANGGTTTVGRVNVTTVQEFGLIGVELAPDFATSGHLYLYYSPNDSNNRDRVSRFTLNGNTLDLASEKVVLEVPVQRAECCHVGGDMKFDTKGNLYISTGDNTNPFASDGFAPIDERAGRSSWDAQRSSGNTNDLRGKVLRIHPEADGTYTIPQGNLFAPGTDKTRPEIYAMGFRNPFKINLDPRSDTVMVAEYGPDAGAANPNRGPDGRVEWNALTQPGNYGWPYCVSDNAAYNDYNFATSTSGAKFDCAGGPTNDSPNNTGLTKLPPAIPATVWYGYGTNPLFPEIGGGGAPMAGGSYVYDANLASDRKWPAYWDGKAIFGEWNQGRLYSFQFANNTPGVPTDINRILPQITWKRTHAIEWGPDGALYVIDWGSGFGGNNADSGIYRIDYVSGNRAPIARITVDKTSGALPLSVAFDAAGSRDPDGTPVTYAWDFNGDGTTDATTATASYNYTTAGTFTARLTVTDEDGQTAVATQQITAGNSAPTITVEVPPNGGVFEFGDTVKYKVTVTDPEDGTIDCQNVVVQPALGHDEHAHGYGQFRGCEGSVAIPGDEGHIGANIFGVLTATYTDKGNGAAGPLTSQQVIVLQPKHKEAEYFSSTGRVAGSTSGGDAGVQTETTSDTGGGQNIGFIEKDDWFAFNPVSLQNVTGIRVRGASEPGGTMAIRVGSPTGTTIGTLTVPAGGWQSWANYEVTLPQDVTRASTTLYFVSTSGQYNVNWVEFIGRGVTDNQRPVVTAAGTPATGTSPLTVNFSTTASDPDGDSPLTYAWTFGDGGTATTANPSHTYTTPGNYTARVTVTDSRGAATTVTVNVVVNAPSTQCFTGRSDDFLGSTLDRTRWTTVVRENQDLRVQNGSLVLKTSNTDIYSTGNTDTPNIVLQDLPSGAFTATAKLTLPARQAYTQAGLMIYGNDDNYAKMVLQARSTGAADAAQRVFQFIREENGTPNEVGESNTANLGAAYPDTVYVRFTSNGTTLNASYSSDGTTFTAMPQTKSLAGITNPKIGLIALQGSGRPQAPIDASFDWFSITPDDKATATGPNDEFEGTSLDGCRWGVVRPDPARMRVTGGNLELDTTTGDIYGTNDTGPKNFVLQPQPAGDWTVETKVDASAFTQQYQQAGLIAYVDDDNYVKLDYLTTNTAANPVARGLEIRSEVGDVVQNPQPSASNLTQGVWHLRLKKAGNVFTGSYSANGTTWTDFATVTNAPVAAAGRVGLYTLGAASTLNAPAKFDYFRVLGATPADSVAPTTTASLNPASPNGSADWYKSAVTVTLAGTDNAGGSGIDRTEYKLDGAATWTAYTAPVAVSADGNHTLVYRSVDKAGNVEADRTVTFKVDATGPAVTVSGVAAGASYGDSGANRTVTFTAADPASGIASTSATLDGQPFTSGTALTLRQLSLGTHTLVVTSTDVAGNVTTSTTTFTVTTSFADIQALMDGYRAAGQLSASAYTNLTDRLTRAAQQAEVGSEAKAIAFLEQFISKAKNQIKGDAQDTIVRNLLMRDAQFLLDGLAAAEAAESAR